MPSGRMTPYVVSPHTRERMGRVKQLLEEEERRQRQAEAERAEKERIAALAQRQRELAEAKRIAELNKWRIMEEEEEERRRQEKEAQEEEQRRVEEEQRQADEDAKRRGAEAAAFFMSHQRLKRKASRPDSAPASGSTRPRRSSLRNDRHSDLKARMTAMMPRRSPTPQFVPGSAPTSYRSTPEPLDEDSFIVVSGDNGRP